MQLLADSVFNVRASCAAFMSKALAVCVTSVQEAWQFHLIKHRLSRFQKNMEVFYLKVQS